MFIIPKDSKNYFCRATYTRYILRRWLILRVEDDENSFSRNIYTVYT